MTELYPQDVSALWLPPWPVRHSPGTAGAVAHAVRWAIFLQVNALRQTLMRRDQLSPPDSEQQLRITLWLWRHEYEQAMNTLWDNHLPLLIVADDVWECLYSAGVPWVLRPFYRPWRTVADRIFGAAVLMDLIHEYHDGRRTGFFDRLRHRGQELSALRAKAHGVGAADRIPPLARFAAVYDVFFADLEQLPEVERT